MPGRRKAPYLAYMHAQIVNEAAFNQRRPLKRVIEQLAHGQRRGALRAQLPEPRNIFRSQGIFQKKQLEWLSLFGEFDGVNGM